MDAGRIPATAEVRAAWCETAGSDDERRELAAEFDAWLTQHDAEMRERIAREIEDDCETIAPPCYACRRAARIARGEDR